VHQGDAEHGQRHRCRDDQPSPGERLAACSLGDRRRRLGRSALAFRPRLIFLALCPLFGFAAGLLLGIAARLLLGGLFGFISAP